MQVPHDAYDVNVTPDKRKVMLHEEGALMRALRDRLQAEYAPSRYTLGAVDNNSTFPAQSLSQGATPRRESLTPTARRMEEVRHP